VSRARTTQGAMTSLSPSRSRGVRWLPRSFSHAHEYFQVSPSPSSRSESSWSRVPLALAYPCCTSHRVLSSMRHPGAFSIWAGALVGVDSATKLRYIDTGIARVYISQCLLQHGLRVPCCARHASLTLPETVIKPCLADETHSTPNNLT